VPGSLRDALLAQFNVMTPIWERRPSVDAESRMIGRTDALTGGT
jgi:hypothetical protein